MSTWELIAEKVKVLPPERQREVLDFVEFVEARQGGTKPRVSAEGLCADLGIDLSGEEITKIREEMWSDFPREDL